MTSARSIGLTVQGTSGGEELVLCPFHQDNKASAWFSPSKELFYCAVCGIGMNLQQLCKKLGVEIVEQFGELEKEPEDYDLFEPHVNLTLGEFEHTYHPYFERRGVSMATASFYDLRWKETEPKAAVLPITNLHGEVKGVVHRYQNPEETGTRYRFLGQPSPVWPMHILGLHEENNLIIVCEGAWSAMKLDSHCFRRIGTHLFSLALLGAKANQRIVDLLKPFRPIFIYDNDTAGRTACHKMRKLAPLWQSYVVSKSPDDMSSKEMEEFFRKLWKKNGRQSA